VYQVGINKGFIGWLFLPNLVAAQLWNSLHLLPKNYSWLSPQQQIFWNSHSIEDENLWRLNVTPIHRQFTFYPSTQYDWINNGGHTYKNTTHQNIIMNYLEFIFLNCTAVMPPTLPLTFWCLSKFQFPFTWWWKIDLLMSSCNNSHMLLHVHNHQNWTQIITLPTVPHES